MQQGEPSLEEILASIKKVMERDETAPRPRDAGEHSPQAAESRDGDPSPQEAAGDILELEAHMLIADAPGAEGSDPEGSDEEGADSTPLPASAELVRREAAAAVRESLAALERLSDAGLTAPSAPVLDPAMEAVARDTLRPMLAEWLETNLPGIVERLVQAEIARIVSRGK